ncbi:hypothetical protein [Nitrosomonas sp.]|uniref:hypothetical protein n=1 Tax=Nitrosomonas sp. TaxID=42353 RepID=UPI00207DECF3|nr:hypothetical protein [Nitrosomonas sp.]GJL74125.1 MAG: hypothetical protein NMNS02_02310 [Nitrosomonas sp.]
MLKSVYKLTDDPDTKHLFLNIARMKEKNWWLISIFISAVLMIILTGLWFQMNKYFVESTKLINEETTNRYLQKNWENKLKEFGYTDQPTIKVKTGIFIQSLKFFNSSEVDLSGYIWQRYQDGIHDAIKPAPSEVGFVLPEQVNTGNAITPQEVYREHANGETTIGWYFEATIRQPFEYKLYPFDHKTVWVRMWHHFFSKNIVLVPDFEAYTSTQSGDIFGIEKEIVLGTWNREDTYFDYKYSSYDTNFGISNYIGQTGFPELHYNFVVKRKFENAFIVYLLPVLLVAALLFGALLTVSNKPDLVSKHGFNTSGFIGACSALFFVVMLAHIQLREQFSGSGIVYMEYFYILMYVYLVIAVVNTYMFSIGAARWLTFIHYRDNLIPKVVYWPVTLMTSILITIGIME